MLVHDGGQQIEVPGVQKYDFASATITYIGEARPGSGDGDNAWRIKRITFDVSGNPSKTEWANGGTAINQWDDRASYAYA